MLGVRHEVHEFLRDAVDARTNLHRFRCISEVAGRQRRRLEHPGNGLKDRRLAGVVLSDQRCVSPEWKSHVTAEPEVSNCDEAELMHVAP